MTVTLHNQHPDSLSIEFWQVAYLALEHYLNGPAEPDGPQHGVEFDLEASSGEEVRLKIWRDEAGQIHIERLPPSNRFGHEFFFNREAGLEYPL